MRRLILILILLSTFFVANATKNYPQSAVAVHFDRSKGELLLNLHTYGNKHRNTPFPNENDVVKYVQVWVEFTDELGILRNVDLAYFKNGSQSDHWGLHHNVSNANSGGSSSQIFYDFDADVAANGAIGNSDYDASSNKYANMIFKNLPNELFRQNFEVLVQILTEDEHDDLTWFPTQPAYRYQVTSIGYGIPLNLDVNRELCDAIELSWSPSTLISTQPINSSNGHAGYDIHRTDDLGNRSRIAADITPTSNSYIDKNVSSDRVYDYTITQKAIYNNGHGNYYMSGNPSSPVTGNTLKNESTIDKIRYNTDACNGSIAVNFDVNQNGNLGSSPTLNNIIERFKYTPGATYTWTLEQTFSEPSSSFDDDVASTRPQAGERYRYNITSRLTCPTPADGNGKIELDGVKKLGTDVYANDVPTKPIINSAIYDRNIKDIIVSYSNTSRFTDNIEIYRTGGNGPERFNITPDTSINAFQTYNDQSVKICEDYTYRVLAQNECSTQGVQSDTTYSAYKPSTDLVTSFALANNGVQSSDGEFGDRVEIKWKPSNREAENWYINRIDPSIPDTTLIAVVDGKSRFYTDRTASANTIYQYEIHGDADCAGNIIESDTAVDHGFRLAFGTVNGQVTYQGGTAVEGAKLVANAATGLSGMSGFFNGSSNINAGNFSDAQSDEMTFMAWVHATAISNGNTIAEKRGGSSGWKLYINNGAISLDTYTNGGNTYTSLVPMNDILNQWTCIAFTVDSDSTKFFKNGVINRALANVNNSSPFDDISNFVIGNGFTGNIDEVKYYNRALSTEEIKQSTDVFVNPSQVGLRGYWRFDEGFGSIIYDYSKTLQTANRNHAQMHNVTFDNQKPSANLLTAGAYTDSTGSYFIPFIPYLGVGDNFTIAPSFGTHNFTPANTALFIGGTSPNFTGKDFIDNSSFRVTGDVKFANTSCFEEDVLIAIDGDVVIKNGEPIKTNDTGKFEIQVPIGEHVITVQKNGHDFEIGRFPQGTGTFNFQKPEVLQTFTDSTLVTVIGRVAGGDIQEGMPKGLGRGTNNIGQTTIVFKSQQANGCLLDSATTIDTSGEYRIALPPMKYEIPNFNVKADPTIRFDDNKLFNISLVPPVQREIDTLYQVTSGVRQIVSIDSTNYQKNLDFIYYKSPQVDVLDENNKRLYGSDTVEFNNKTANLKVPASSLNLNYPIFKENNEYKWKIFASSVYINKDKDITSLKNDTSKWEFDTVPMVRGKIQIINELAKKQLTEFNYFPVDSFAGVQEYSFFTGQAKTSPNSQTPEWSFTKTLNINLITPHTNAVGWKPNMDKTVTGPVPNDGLFRGIVFGGKALGNSFATAGPQVVTMILRDPPGSNSFATWSSGESHSTTSSYEIGGGISTDLNKRVIVGTKFSAGLGYITETEIKNNIVSTTNIQPSTTNTDETIETVTRTVDISTSSSNEFVGSEADLFFGRSFNMDFGLVKKVQLIDANFCGTGTNVCTGQTYTQGGQSFRVGTTTGMFVIPGGYGTEFAFTQRGIEELVIPKLIDLRDNLLQNNSNYKSKIQPGQPNYGKSNDDPIFMSLATPDPKKGNYQDSTGQSYSFSGYTERNENVNGKSVVLKVGVDSVWWYNHQADLWIETLKRNEREKALAVLNNTPVRNVSYQSGGPLTYTTETSKEETTLHEIALNIDEDLALHIGGEVGGNGVEIEQGVTINVSTNKTFGSGSTNSTTFSYTFDDTDDDDEFTVDISKSKDGFGPLFYTRAGQTSCPYQGSEKTQYYTPITEINKATIKLDTPEINVSIPVLNNIPADQEGRFILTLSNEGKEGMLYGLKILDGTNPNGAIIKVDGLPPTRTYSIDGNSSIVKTLTIERGGPHIKYDSIGVVFHSDCQYAAGTAGFEDIADTAYISINFLPSCTETKILSPQDLFILNNNAPDNKSLPVTISDYDINYFGLNHIGFQYRPSNQSSWVTLNDEWYATQSLLDTANKKDPDNASTRALIPTGTPTISTNIDFSKLIDQGYQVRAYSECVVEVNEGDPTLPPHKEYSPMVTGLADRVNPNPFGTPSPADGVLDPNDDISIKFNEDIEAGSLTPDNFQLTGVLNNEPIRHDKSVAFNGTSSYLEIAEGFSFTERDFTIEFWLKPSKLGAYQTIISQGVDASNEFYIGINDANKFEIQMGNSSNSFTTTNVEITAADTNKWIHMSISYDAQLRDLEVVKRLTADEKSDNHTLNAAHNFGGKTFIGRMADPNLGNYLDGSIHNFRIWNKALLNSTISNRSSLLLTGREKGLLAYWPMNEGSGNVVHDIARGRNLTLNGGWEISPLGYYANFDASADPPKYLLTTEAGNVSINSEMDMTVEFWFKTNSPNVQTFISTGPEFETAAGTRQKDWSIGLDSNQKIVIYNNDSIFEMVSDNFSDNEWHHFAFVLDRRSNATAYVDGKRKNTHPSSNFTGLGNNVLFLGARLWNETAQDDISLDQKYTGSLDEVRIWNSARLIRNIELNKDHALIGNEAGLQVYYPFETYSAANLSNVSTPDEKSTKNGNLLKLLNVYNLLALDASNTAPIPPNLIDSIDHFSNSAPPSISLPPQVSKVNFSWNLNGDEIIISPTESVDRIENVTLFVTVDSVKDLRGNFMQSPKSWIAYVNKNQMVWQDPVENKSKELNDTMTFVNTIVNNGGQLKNYTLNNLPWWLSSSNLGGSVSPLGSQSITFTVDPSVGIGDYSEDVHLESSDGIDEKFQVNLKVRKAAPNFSVNPANFQHSMSFIGQISINDRVSSNEEDMLIAFDDNDQVRGVAQLQYEELFDRYMIYLDVYSNTSGDSISFKIWNSRSGELHADAEMIEPVFGKKIAFATNSVIGTPSIPQLFNAIDYIEKPIALSQGWNWVSFPLLNENQNNFNKFFVKEFSRNVSEIKSESAIRKPNNGTWRNGGLNEIKNEQSYLIKMKHADTLDYYGFAFGADTMPISVYPGWNRIGYISLSNMPLQTALANYNAKEGDVIKSQDNFAYYDSTLGWVGSLTAMKSTEGYLMKVRDSSTFTYPLTAQFRLKGNLENQEEIMKKLLSDKYQFDVGSFEATSNAIAFIDCEYISNNKNLLLAAYHGEDIRGLASVDDLQGENRSYLTIYGEANETFNYVLIDTMKEETYTMKQSIQFAKNSLSGTPKDPIKINLLVAEDCEQFKPEIKSIESVISPNPFREGLTISLSMDLIEQTTIEFIDTKGRVLSRFNANGRSQIELANEYPTLKELPAGTYYIKISGKDEVLIEKAIKL